MVGDFRVLAQLSILSSGSLINLSLNFPTRWRHHLFSPVYAGHVSLLSAHWRIEERGLSIIVLARNEALSDYALHLDPTLYSGMGTVNPQIRHCTEKSFVTHYQVECAETNIGISDTYSYVTFSDERS